MRATKTELENFIKRYFLRSVVTFILTYNVALIVMLEYLNRRFPDFNALDFVERQAFAGIGLVGATTFISFVPAVTHFGINYCKQLKDRSDYSVQVDNSLSEMTGLIGQDHGGVSIFRVGNYHPLHMVYPPTPIKTGLWIPIIGLLIFALANLINPDLFNEFAGNSPVAHKVFTNCTMTDNPILESNVTCVSTVGFNMGCFTLAGVLPYVFAATTVFFHYKIMEAMRSRGEDNQSENDESLEGGEPLYTDFNF